MTKLHLQPQPTPGLLCPENTGPGLEGGQWYESPVSGEGLVYDFAAGSLAPFQWLTADFLSPAVTDLALVLELHEENGTRPCICRFTLLPKAQARLRFSLEAVNQNRWRYHREGACLKPTMSGGRVDLSRVNRLKIKVLYKSGPARWAMTPLQACPERPPLLLHPLLLQGALLDELGQARFREWKGKTATETELRERLNRQLAAAAGGAFPDSFSRWGGWKEKKAGGSGFFRTHHDGKRWWLLDPEGYCFWSTGPCCVRPGIESNIRLLHDALTWLPDRQGDYRDCFSGGEPSADGESEEEAEEFDYLIANLIRAFGAEHWEEKWAELVFPLMRGIGFNTSANWSDTTASGAARMPYVFPMAPAPEEGQALRIFRDLPDVFSPDFENEAAVFASQLKEGKDDPARIGYFLMNEPQWAFTDLTVAEGMMWNCPDCASRRAFAADLKEKYGDDAGLRKAWKMKAGLEEVAFGKWSEPFSEEAIGDLKKFSTRLASLFYRMLDEACRKADPNHLNLGARFSSVPKDWLVEAVAGFDIFSINCYQPEPDPRLEGICRKWNIPAMIGEWHYGALDAGLPAPGIGHVADQAARGRAYRYYVESSAARTWCVGAHWFTLYDQSALGRGDGENYNIGFVDVCHRIYEPLAAAALETHRRLYRVAAGLEEPFAEAPEIVERLNM